MSKPKPPEGTADERQKRLAAALRDNLKRRKAQARARSDVPQAPQAEKPENTPPGKG